MTKRECAVIMTYTGVCMLTGDDIKYFYEYIAELIERPAFSHEIPSLSDDLKEKAKPDFIRICREAAEPKAKTNGDRIRKMTDDAELLEAIGTACFRCKYRFGECCNGYYMDGGCVEGNLEWLKEVSEDAAD